MQHSFDIDIAKRLWVDEAIFLNNLVFWLHKNKANKQHFYDWYYWTYNSVSSYKELFPYWWEAKISKMINKLEKLGVMKSWNYNKSPYDRTKRYTIVDETIYNSSKIDFAKRENETCQKDEPIPDINTDKKPDKKTYISEFSIGLQKSILEFIDLRKKMRKPLIITKSRVDKLKILWNNNEDLMVCIVEQSIANNRQWIFELKWEKPSKAYTVRELADWIEKAKAYKDSVKQDFFDKFWEDKRPEARKEYDLVYRKSLIYNP